MLKFSLLALMCAATALAHIGSPDIFLEGKAGNYPLFITIRPPVVIPGVAEVEIRVRAQGVSQVRIVPTPLNGPGARFAPTPDIATQAKDDPQFFTGAIWIMTSGSWQVKVSVEGSQGTGTFAVPVPALAKSTEKMQSGLGITLAILGLILGIGAISIAGAASREAQLDPGLPPTEATSRKARITMAIVAVIVVGSLYLGNNWWTAEAGNYGRIIYKPLEMKPSFNNGILSLELSDPGWLGRQVSDFIPDHNHLMHMYVVKLPEMDRVWHLHPELTGSAVFAHQLPTMPAGTYALFADLVHQNGLPETISAQIDLPEVPGKALEGDDSLGLGPAISQAKTDNRFFVFADGVKVEWDRDTDTFPTKKPYSLRFKVFNADGKPADDMQLYMGMPGHAAFIKRDLGVFAHIHPTGSVSMASLALTQNATDPHAGHDMSKMSLPAEVSFPYGFPQPGDYRILVQFKKGDTIRTAFFDTKVQ